MAMPNDFAASQAPSYIIYRDVPAGELYDPTAPLAFFPPKDSDELFDALRAKYPHLKSHSERMRDATIEFLLEERQVDSMSATVSPAMPSLYDSMTDASPWQQSWPSASMTTLSSPEMTNFATPSFDDSPMPSKQSSESQTPAIDQMTSVFSLSTSEQPKQRVRRKMTEAEKVEYRKRRIVKACDKCSKRKRKCTHNQPEIEGLKTSNDKSAHKIIKPRGTATKSNQNFEVTNTLFDLQETDMSNLFTSDALTGGYEDFTLMFDDPTLDFSFDEFMPFDQQQSFAPADNFRQCTQQFNTDNATSKRSTNSWESRAPHNAAAVDSCPSMLQGNSELEWGHDLVIPRSPQVFDSRHTRRRCDLAHSQSGSAPLSSPQSPNAGQLDGLAEAATLTSASGILASSSRPSHAQDSQTQSFLSQMRSGEIRGSTCEEDPGRSVDDGASLQAHTSRAQRPEATRSLRSHESSMEANGLEAIRGRPATQLRYRLRDAGTNDPALMSELSSTSATSSRSSSGLNSTAALEGRPSIRGQDTNSARMSNRSDAKNARSLPTATPRSSMPSRSSPTQGENVSHGLAGTTQNATPSRAPANLLPQRTSVPSVLQARPSSLDDSMTLRSSEIFRLKNRIPASLDGTSPASLHARPTAGLSVQANGGTKQQLDVASNALRPAAGHQTHEAARASTTSADDKSKSTEASGMRRIFTESDTNRERDHHGRDLSSQPTARQSTFTQWLARSEHISLRNAFAITALVALCLLAFNLLHMSILALALCAPVLIGNSRQSKASSPILDLRSRAQMTIRKRLSSSSAFRTTLQRTVCV